MDKKNENEIRKELAVAVQKSLIAHQFDPEKIDETMKFIGLVIGGMIGSIYDEEEHDREVSTIIEHVREGIKKGLP